jgi:hypothetical protein
MEIPIPYIFKIETPTLLFRNHLFQPRIETTNDSNYMDVLGKKLNLEEIATPKVLEDIYFDNNKELFEQYKQDFVSTSMNQLYLSADNIEAELKNNRTLSLIVNEILPVITSVKVDNQLDAALNDKNYNPKEDMKDIFSNLTRSPGRLRVENDSSVVDTTRNELIANIEKMYSHVGVQKSKKSKLEDCITRELIGVGRNARVTSASESSILVDELLGESNFLFVENRTYELYTIPKLMSEFKNKMSEGYFREISKVGPDVDPSIVIENVKKHYDQIDSSVLSRIINKLKGTKLNIEGNYFFPLYFNETTDMISDYTKLIEKKLKIEAVNHTRFQAESLRKIAEEKSQLSKLVNTDKFEMNGAGFEKLNGSYYVYITTPEYVLRSPHNSNDYYKFGRAKIGVEIEMHGNNSVEIMEPYVMNNYMHPFLPGHSTLQKICMGQYKTDSARRLPPGQAVLTILTKAQENLMLGYKTGGNPHHALNDSTFRAYKITKQEFERSGLVCLNDYRDSRR